MTVDHWIEASEKAQDGQLKDIKEIGQLDVESSLADNLEGYTVLGEGGEVLACIGVQEVDEDTAYAWTIMVADIGARLIGITRCVRIWLDGCGYKHVMADVREEFIEGQRWAELLGFVPIGVIESYYEDGGDAIKYRRETSWVH